MGSPPTPDDRAPATGRRTWGGTCTLSSSAVAASSLSPADFHALGEIMGLAKSVRLFFKTVGTKPLLKLASCTFLKYTVKAGLRWREQRQLPECAGAGARHAVRPHGAQHVRGGDGASEHGPPRESSACLPCPGSKTGAHGTSVTHHAASEGLGGRPRGPRSPTPGDLASGRG